MFDTPNSHGRNPDRTPRFNLRQMKKLPFFLGGLATSMIALLQFGSSSVIAAELPQVDKSGADQNRAVLTQPNLVAAPQLPTITQLQNSSNKTEVTDPEPPASKSSSAELPSSTSLAAPVITETAVPVAGEIAPPPLIGQPETSVESSDPTPPVQIISPTAQPAQSQPPVKLSGILQAPVPLPTPETLRRDKVAAEQPQTTITQPQRESAAAMEAHNASLRKAPENTKARQQTTSPESQYTNMSVDQLKAEMARLDSDKQLANSLTNVGQRALATRKAEDGLRSVGDALRIRLTQRPVKTAGTVDDLREVQRGSVGSLEGTLQSKLNTQPSRNTREQSTQRLIEQGLMRLPNLSSSQISNGLESIRLERRDIIRRYNLGFRLAQTDLNRLATIDSQESFLIQYPVIQKSFDGMRAQISSPNELRKIRDLLYPNLPDSIRQMVDRGVPDRTLYSIGLGHNPDPSAIDGGMSIRAQIQFPF